MSKESFWSNVSSKTAKVGVPLNHQKSSIFIGCPIANYFGDPPLMEPPVSFSKHHGPLERAPAFEIQEVVKVPTCLGCLLSNQICTSTGRAVGIWFWLEKNGVYHGVPLYGQFAVTCSSWIFDHHFQPFPILPTQIHWYIAKTLVILHRLSSPTMLLSWKPLNPPGILLDHTWLCSFRLCVRDIIPQLSSIIPTIDVCYFSVRLERCHTSNPRIHHLGPLLDVQPPWIAQHISQLRTTYPYIVPYIHI